MREIKFRVWDKAINKMITQENVKEFLGKTISEKWEDELPYSNDEWYPAYEILTIFDYLKDFQERTIKRYEPSENRFELMQYTGLHDKNGKEIYEGDIVKISEKNNIAKHKVISMKPIIAEISWSEEYLAYILITTSAKDAFENIADYLDDYDIEKIGNIYENKELLNETDR